MKKVLSIVLAVAMLATLCSVCFTVNAEDAHSLIEPDLSKWVKKDGGEGTITNLSFDDKGLTVAGNKGWPNVTNNFGDEGGPGKNMYTIDQAGQYLNFDITVKGATNINLYFNGQNPADQAANEHYRTIVDLISGGKVQNVPGNQPDLEAGEYKGSVELTAFAQQGTEDGKLQISGIAIFAVGENSEIVIHELSVGAKTQSDTPTQPAASTTKGGATTTAAAPTTTAANAKTGIEDNVALYAIIALGAATVITVSVVSSKKARNK